MKTNWITLYPETFIWLKESKGYIHNSKTMKGDHFDCNIIISNVCRQLITPESLYSAAITPKDLEDKEFKNWIDLITVRLQAGFITSCREKKPVSFKPILKLHKNVDRLIWEHNQGNGGNTMQYLHELTFYLNKTSTGNNFWFRQTIFPLKDCVQLPISSILSFIKNSQNPFLTNINLVGNIFSYAEYNKLLMEIKNFKINIAIYITIQDFSEHIKEIREINQFEQFQFIILIDFAYDFNIPLIPLELLGVNVSITAFITSVDEFTFFDNVTKDMPIYCEAKLIPLYAGINLDFFKGEVFTTTEDLIDMKLTKREIFMHQTLNTNDFGKLTILPDGSVYANVNKPSLGTINDSVYSIIYKEITEGVSWFRIRSTEPCGSCLYQWLCPSPCNYELAIDKPNLCHIKS